MGDPKLIQWWRDVPGQWSGRARGEGWSAESRVWYVPELEGWGASVTLNTAVVHGSEHPTREIAKEACGLALVTGLYLRGFVSVEGQL